VNPLVLAGPKPVSLSLMPPAGEERASAENEGGGEPPCLAIFLDLDCDRSGLAACLAAGAYILAAPRYRRRGAGAVCHRPRRVPTPRRSSLFPPRWPISPRSRASRHPMALHSRPARYRRRPVQSSPTFAAVAGLGPAPTAARPAWWRPVNCAQRRVPWRESTVIVRQSEDAWRERHLSFFLIARCGQAPS